MANRFFSSPVSQLALECGAASGLATPVLLGWRERLLHALNQIRWSRFPAPAEPIPAGCEALAGLDEHLLADIGAPESVRERARHWRHLQHQRVLEMEHGHRSIGDGRW